MKKSLLRLSLAGVLGLSLLIGAPMDEATFEKCMKMVGQVCGEVKKNIEAKDLKAAAENAAKLQKALTASKEFWEGKKTSDAIKISTDAAAAAGEVASAASAGHQDHAEASFKNVLSNCGACHKVHREKTPEGKYKIK